MYVPRPWLFVVSPWLHSVCVSVCAPTLVVYFLYECASAPTLVVRYFALITFCVCARAPTLVVRCFALITFCVYARAPTLVVRYFALITFCLCVRAPTLVVCCFSLITFCLYLCAPTMVVCCFSLIISVRVCVQVPRSWMFVISPLITFCARLSRSW